MKEKNWYQKEIEEIFEELNSDIKGLYESEAKRRLKENGLNVLPKSKKHGIIAIFFSQFKNPIVFLLLIAIFLSILIGETIDAIFITAVILVDIIFGAFQEWKAGKNSDALQQLIKVESKVIREGKLLIVDSEELTIGDIVVLESGDKISADLRIFESNNLTIDESILTGESTAASKNNTLISSDSVITDRNNMAYAGTLVLTGRAKCIVVETATNTEIGKITESVLSAKDTPPPLIIRMEKFTKQIGQIIAVISIIFIVILYLRGYAPKEMFFLVIALSISAIPEGLPVVLTLALSIASNKMAKKNVIVKKLNFVESLGSCTVIASDKTGTLTLNQQTAKKILLPDDEEIEITGIGYNGIGKVLFNKNNEKEVIDLALMGALNNEASLELERTQWKFRGDSIDVAFLSLAYKCRVINEVQNINIINEIPYESENKYSAAFFKDRKVYVSAKGSVETILSFSNRMMLKGKVVPIDKASILKQNQELASKGYRVIAICKHEIAEKNSYSEKDLKNSVFLGLVAFIDPVRKEAISSIKKALKAGIKVTMITGDHPLTAFSIGKELGIVENLDEVSTGDKLEIEFKKGKKNFDSFIKDLKIFARVTPIQKLEIVESYKRQKEFVAVTGDGVNDAPALKAANIGVAMGSGTEVAKDTSTMIITDDNFKSIVSGIEEGRIAYNNIRKVIYYLISNGVAEVLFFVLAIIFNLPLPLLAIQLLWLNLVTDGIQDIGLAFEKGFEDVMNDKPRKTNEKIFDKLLIQETLISGLSIGLIVYVVWHYLIVYTNIDLVIARSYILILMVFMQNIHAFNCRNENTSAFKIPIKNNPFIIFAIILTIILQIVIIHNPYASSILKVGALSYKSILLMFLLAIPILFVMETFKYFKKKNNR